MRNLFLTIAFFCTSTIIGFGQTDVVQIDLNDTTTLTLHRENFVLTDQNVEYENEKYPSKINGKEIFGTDGDLPKYQLTKAILKIGDETIDLETTQMYNPWFGTSPNATSFKLTINLKGLRLKGMFSDGAGTYLGEWEIIGKNSERIRLTIDDEVIIQSFYND